MLSSLAMGTVMVGVCAARSIAPSGTVPIVGSGATFLVFARFLAASIISRAMGISLRLGQTSAMLKMILQNPRGQCGRNRSAVGLDGADDFAAADYFRG
jgi:hypothetical protein